MKLHESQIDLFQLNTPRTDPVDGATLRNRGVAKVLSNNESWMEQALAAFESWSSPAEFTGEDVRIMCEERNLFPAHSNAWGALVNALTRQGLIVPTGELTRMIDPRSHSRKTPLYKRS